MTTLSHEKLDAYRVAIQFFAFCTELLETFPRGHAALADELPRASLSIPLTTAEAVGKTTTADTCRYFAIARGSALECSAILDACEILGIVDSPTKKMGKDLLVREVSMLSKLCR